MQKNTLLRQGVCFCRFKKVMVSRRNEYAECSLQSQSGGFHLKINGFN
jgi:hypothetical protein